MMHDDRRRDARQGKGEREGFWGRGHLGRGFEQGVRRDHSREDYGATGRGEKRNPDDADRPAEDPAPDTAEVTNLGAGTPGRD